MASDPFNAILEAGKIEQQRKIIRKLKTDMDFMVKEGLKTSVTRGYFLAYATICAELEEDPLLK